jgi:hypothetical protein
MEAKMAFQELMEGRGGGANGGRAGGTGGTGGGWGSSSPSSSSSTSSWGSSSSSPGGGDGASARTRKEGSDQPFYGFSDFFRDLENDLDDRSGRRKEGSGGGSGSGSGGASSPGPTGSTPGSLWEELAALGAEFLEFLEAEAGLTGDGRAPDRESYAAAAQAA